MYTRTPYATRKVVERATRACERTGLFKYSDFKVPDNSCPAQARGTQALLLREKYATKIFLTAERELQEEATTIRKNAVQTFTTDVQEVVQATAKLEKAIEDYEKVLANDIKAAEKSAGRAIEKAESLLVKPPLTKVPK